MGFISSGLGGTRDKLRYYFLVMPIDDNIFTNTQVNIIKSESDIIAKELDCIVESVIPSDKHVALIVLISMDVAIASFIEPIISKCNELGEFVYEHYYVTNTNIPDQEEIDEVIKIVKAD